MEGEEIIKEKREPITISVYPSVRKELVKTKKIDPGHISISALVEFCTMYPYSLGDVIVALEVLNDYQNKRLIMCFYRKDYEEATKIIREVLDKKREKEFKLEDAVRYINAGKDGGVRKIIKEIEDKLADLKVKIKIR